MSSLKLEPGWVFLWFPLFRTECLCLWRNNALSINASQYLMYLRFCHLIFVYLFAEFFLCFLSTFNFKILFQLFFIKFTEPNLYFQSLSLSRWKGTGDLINTFFWCRLCALAHDATSRGHSWYGNINDWWRGKDICIGKKTWRDMPRSGSLLAPLAHTVPPDPHWPLWVGKGGGNKREWNARELWGLSRLR